MRLRWLVPAWVAAVAFGSPSDGHPPTLDRRVMTGYQGWFRAPGDGSGMGWAHYQRRGGASFLAANLSIDYWPDLTGFSPGERYPTPLKDSDGRPAELFSSHNPQTIDRHFRWMREYGIDGAFLQRFPSSLLGRDSRGLARKKAADEVLGFACSAAERAGRSFAIMYDLSGLPKGAMPRVMEDWKYLVDDLHLLASPQYQYHRGRPVIALWGVGFDDGRAYTLEEVAQLVSFLKHDPRYGGNTVMLGIPTWWRDGSEDAVRGPALAQVLAQADILSPWTPGRYSDLGGVRAHAERFWIPDRAWCTERGIDYMPVVFPGFSWRNLKGTDDGIDRQDGRFLWEQYRVLIDAGFSMIYQAMFDEMDEGTQIFKTEARPPPGESLLSYDPLPADHYLWLTGTAAGYLHRGLPMPERIVERAGDPATTRYLRGGDEAAYASVPVSFEAHTRFFAIEDALEGNPGGWAAVDRTGARVSAIGAWGSRHVSSTDRKASLSWELPVRTGGDYALEVRSPADGRRIRLQRAHLSVSQNGIRVVDAPIDLALSSPGWQRVFWVRLDGKAPCLVTIDRPISANPLILFEPRIRDCLQTD